MIDEDLYQAAADELNSDRRKPALWRRACALASDDHDEARYLYTTLRVDELIQERDSAAVIVSDEDLVDETIVDEDDTLVRSTFDETVDGDQVKSFMEDFSVADASEEPGMAASDVTETEAPGFVDASIELMPLDEATLGNVDSGAGNQADAALGDTPRGDAQSLDGIAADTALFDVAPDDAGLSGEGLGDSGLGDPALNDAAMDDSAVNDIVLDGVLIDDLDPDDTELDILGLDDTLSNSPVTGDLPEEPDSDLMADYIPEPDVSQISNSVKSSNLQDSSTSQEASSGIGGSGIDGVEPDSSDDNELVTDGSMRNDHVGDFSLYSNTTEGRPESGITEYDDGIDTGEFSSDFTSDLTQANVNVLDAYGDELDQMMDDTIDSTGTERDDETAEFETITAESLAADTLAAESGAAEPVAEEKLDAEAVNNEAIDIASADFESTDFQAANFETAAAENDAEIVSEPDAWQRNEVVYDEDSIAYQEDPVAEKFNRQAEELELGESGQRTATEYSDETLQPFDHHLENEFDHSSAQPPSHDTTGTQPSYDLGEADVPAVAAAAAIAPAPAPGPQNLNLGPAEENTYDANVDYENGYQPLDLTHGRKGKLYSIYQRNSKALAVNNGVSWSALFLTLPFLVYRTLFGTAFVYLLLWILCLGGLLVSGLAWIDAGDAVTPVVQLGTIGFALIAFVGLIYLPFRYGNIWRMNKMEDRGYELVAITRAKNPGQAVARARRHSVLATE